MTYFIVCGYYGPIPRTTARQRGQSMTSIPVTTDKYSGTNVMTAQYLARAECSAGGLALRRKVKPTHHTSVGCTSKGTLFARILSEIAEYIKSREKLYAWMKIGCDRISRAHNQSCFSRCKTKRKGPRPSPLCSFRQCSSLLRELVLLSTRGRRIRKDEHQTEERYLTSTSIDPAHQT